ncbi:hypothetical protein SIM22_04200 [Bacillus cereus group sp. BfR-BA-01363]|uniref:hypothetical protein n=1 Tax=Bacillus cereus group sp. BfR-BA-01363 TaxID=3094882 RepID=UPI0029C2A29C|nr:hypothetical protein [Bacillus cereus group sp. BfR-BA-01363]MDX5853330.1 hypothetical protein [Bacillus cereus group sp. BfR-BA-01363]
MMNEVLQKALRDYILQERKLNKRQPYLSEYEDGVIEGVNDTLEAIETLKDIQSLEKQIKNERRWHKREAFLSDYENGVNEGVNDTLDVVERIINEHALGIESFVQLIQATETLSTGMNVFIAKGMIYRLYRNEQGEKYIIDNAGEFFKLTDLHICKKFNVVKTIDITK